MAGHCAAPRCGQRCPNPSLWQPPTIRMVLSRNSQKRTQARCFLRGTHRAKRKSIVRNLCSSARGINGRLAIVLASRVKPPTYGRVSALHNVLRTRTFAAQLEKDWIVVSGDLTV